MKLPIILGSMIAALAIPGSIASEAEATTEEKTETVAPEAGKEAPKTKGKKKRHAKGGHHHKKHAHHDSHANSPTEPYKGEYDEKLRAADGDVNKDLSPPAGAHVAPGHKAP